MENRKAHRVVFERGFAANMMAIDGTWRRPCTMEDVSETGARLTVDGSIEGLHLKEFFLLLSTMGKAYRRCQLAWVNGDQVGVFFLKPGDKKKDPKRPSVSLCDYLTVLVRRSLSICHAWQWVRDGASPESKLTQLRQTPEG